MRWRIVAEVLISNNSECLKSGLNLHESWHHEEEPGYCIVSGGIMLGRLGCARYGSEHLKTCGRSRIGSWRLRVAPLRQSSEAFPHPHGTTAFTGRAAGRVGDAE